MSYSLKIKQEVYRIKQNRCCRFSELYGFFLACGAFSDDGRIRFAVKNKTFFEYYAGLFDRICQTAAGKINIIQKGRKDVTYIFEIYDETCAEQVRGIFGYPSNILDCNAFVSEMQSCCARAFLRGAFIGTGFISEPSGRYCLEIVVKEQGAAPVFAALMNSIGLYPKTGRRAGKDILYIKTAEEIGDFLGNIGAKRSAFEYANAEIEKTVLNSVNRLMNCETANINRMVDTAERQRTAILKLKARGYRNIDPMLRDIAELRLENMELSLTQLGMLHSPPLSKSGVAHRMKKIIELADALPE